MPRKRGRTTIRVPGVRVADDLVERDFRPAAPNLLWVADITYLRTWEGWLYLAAVQDAFAGGSSAGRWPSTCAQSWSSTRCRWRSPAAARSPAWFITPIRARNSCLWPSAKRPRRRHRRLDGFKGRAYDNAVAESFFATLKKELVHRRSWPTRRELIGEVFEYVEAFYNPPAGTPRWGCSLPLSSRMNISLSKRKRSTTTRLASQAQLCPLGRGRTNDYLFVNDAGEPWDHRNIGGRALRRAMTTARYDNGNLIWPELSDPDVEVDADKLPSFHAYRHTFASAFIAGGGDLVTLSRHLGTLQSLDHRQHLQPRV